MKQLSNQVVHLMNEEVSPAIPPQSASSVSKIIANSKTTATGIQQRKDYVSGAKHLNTQVAPQSNTAMRPVTKGNR